MIQFNSNTTDGLYCGSSNTCSAPVTTRSPFSEVHLHPTSSPNARASAVFRFLPSPLHYTTVRSYETVICGWRLHPNFLHRWRQKNGISSRAKHNVSTNCGWRRRVKAGIANSLSARCAGACLFARADVRMRKQWATWWTKERASFQKKAGRKKRKKGVFRKKVHNFSFNLSRFSRS